MTADALTKPMIAPPLLHLLSSGMVEFKNEPDHPLLFRRLPPLHDYDEDTILKQDDELIKGALLVLAAKAARVSKPFLMMTVLASQVGGATSSSATETPMPSSSYIEYDVILFTSSRSSPSLPWKGCYADKLTVHASGLLHGHPLQRRHHRLLRQQEQHR